MACEVHWGASLQKPRMSFGDFLGIFLGIFREIEDFKDFKAFVRIFSGDLPHLFIPCSQRKKNVGIMDDSSYRLNFNLGEKNEIHHYSQKEQLKISKIAKFGREML